MRTALGHKEIVVITLFIYILDQNSSSATKSGSTRSSSSSGTQSTTSLQAMQRQQHHHQQQQQSKNSICNNGTNHQCRCSNVNADNSDTANIEPCQQFIQEEELDVLRLQWPWHDLSKWHKNETYEQFFKRQIANTVSRYCEQQANQCRGAYLRIDEGNMILLKTETIDDRTMNLTFVIAKNAHQKQITSKRIMNSTRIRALLIQKKNELKNAFSGVTINSSTITVIKIRNKVEDNTRLLTLVFLIGFFFTITYVVAAVKVCRDHYYKRKAKWRAGNKAVTENNVPDYGSCEVTPRIKTQGYEDNRLLNQRTNSPETLDLAVRIAEPSPSPVDERSIQRMFECDPSQLPAEQPLWSQQSSLEGPIPSTSRSDDKYKENPGPKTTADENEKEIKIEVVPETTVYQSVDKEDLNSPIRNHESAIKKTFGSTEKFLPKYKADTLVTRSKTAHEIGNWSSDSDDEHNDVYYRLSEVECESEINEKAKNNSDSEEEYGPIENDSSFETTHLYQRLEESPTPMPNNSGPTTLA